MKNTLKLLGLLLFLGSCRKSEVNPNASSLIQQDVKDNFSNTWSGDEELVSSFTNFMQQMDEETYAEINLNKQNSNIEGTRSNINFYFLLPTSTGKLEVTAPNNTYALDEDADSKTFYTHDKELASNLQGSEVVFSTTLDNGEKWEDKIYVPKNLVITKGIESSVSKSKGIDLSWEADEANDKGIIITLSSKYTLGYNPDSTIPEANHVIIVRDNGKYTLSTDDLKVFVAEKGSLSISITRGNYKMGALNGKKMRILTSNSYREYTKLVE
ncbi:MAG: hypothetical protein RLZZ292_2775 [Bacteroidota bacterium]|jgi:hypothetical protein